MRRVMQQTLNGPVAASQSDQEAASSNTVFVTPSIQHQHPSAAKALAFVLASGGTAPYLATGFSFNVASVCGTGAGIVNVYFTNNFSTSQILPVVTFSTSAVGTARFIATFSLSSGGFGIAINTPGSALTTNWVSVQVAVYGDMP